MTDRTLPEGGTLEGTLSEIEAAWLARGATLRRPKFPRALRDGYQLIAVRDGRQVGEAVMKMRTVPARGVTDLPPIVPWPVGPEPGGATMRLVAA